MTPRSNPPAMIEYVWLPRAEDMPPMGQEETYDAQGRLARGGSVKIQNLGIQFIWARFQEPVKAGQVATMVVQNMISKVFAANGTVELVSGVAVPGGAATQWDLSTGQPTFGDAVVELLSVEQGDGNARIVCRNTYDADLDVAVGLASALAIHLPPPS